MTKRFRIGVASAVIAYLAVIGLHLSGFVPDNVFAVLNRLTTAVMVSFLFYILVVRVPARARRALLTDALARQLTRFKEDVAFQLLLAARRAGDTRLEADADTVATLLSRDGFEAAFPDRPAPFDTILARGEEEYLQILSAMRTLADQIRTLLGSATLTDAELYESLNALEMRLNTVARMQEGDRRETAVAAIIEDIFVADTTLEARLRAE